MSTREIPFGELPPRGIENMEVVAVPIRGPAHDVLVTREAVTLDALPEGLRVGVDTVPRAAQLRRVGPVEVVRLEDANLDGVIVAAGESPLFRGEKGEAPLSYLELPLDRFVPAPGQGATAILISKHDWESRDRVAQRDHPPTSRAVFAELAFRRRLGGAPHAPLAAYARCDDDGSIHLHGQLYSPDGAAMVEATLVGDDPQQVGELLARRLGAQLMEQLNSSVSAGGTHPGRST
jgi:hydroxymethylbilane synthase